MSKIVTAGLIIIGDEILSGKTRDANTQALAKGLNSVGIQLREVRVIPDVKETIVATVNHFRNAWDYVFTTGGIGPTHDDITTESLAEAFGQELVIEQQSYDQLAAYYAHKGEDFTPARQKMVKIPQGAKAIPNDITIAPGVQYENVYTLAGVPSIMRSMLEHILPTLKGGASLISYSVATNIGESIFADALAVLQEQYPDVSIGSYPKFDASDLKVTVVLRHTDEPMIQIVMEKVIALITANGGEILSSGRLQEG